MYFSRFLVVFLCCGSLCFLFYEKPEKITDQFKKPEKISDQEVATRRVNRFIKSIKDVELYLKDSHQRMVLRRALSLYGMYAEYLYRGVVVRPAAFVRRFVTVVFRDSSNHGVSEGVYIIMTETKSKSILLTLSRSRLINAQTAIHEALHFFGKTEIECRRWDALLFSQFPNCGDVDLEHSVFEDFFFMMKMRDAKKLRNFFVEDEYLLYQSFSCQGMRYANAQKLALARYADYIQMTPSPDYYFGHDHAQKLTEYMFYFDSRCFH